MDIPPILSQRIKTELIYIDPTINGFWNLTDWDVKFESIILNERYNEFKTMLKKAKQNSHAFWKPNCDPSLSGKKIVFQKNKTPATGYTISWWENTIKKIPKFHNCNWTLGSQDEYTIYLVYLIHKLCNYGFSISDSIRFIIWNSEKIAYCKNQSEIISKTGSQGELSDFELDLGNTKKILTNSSYEKNDFYHKKNEPIHLDYILAGCSYKYKGYESALFNAKKINAKRKIYSDAVAWIVLRN